MKKITAFLLFIFVYSTAFADITDFIDGLDKPMKVDIANNPVSLNGTYEIERFVIVADKKIFIDSSDKQAVTAGKGHVTIDLNITKGEIKSTLKMQMKGNIFSSGSAFAPYNFIYSNRIIPISTDKNKSLEEKTADVGLHYYTNENRLIWEIPFEQNKIIIIVLEKESDKVKKINNSKYMFL